MVYSSRWILKWSSLGDSYDSHSHQLTIDWEWVGHQLHMACINVSLQYQKMAWYTNLEHHYPTCPSTLPVVLRIFISHILALLFQDTKLGYVMELLLSVACFGPNLPWGTCPCKPPLRHALMAVLKVTASGRAWRSHQPSEIGNEDCRYPNDSLAPFQHPHWYLYIPRKDSKNFIASFEVIPTFIQAIYSFLCRSFSSKCGNLKLFLAAHLWVTRNSRSSKPSLTIPWYRPCHLTTSQGAGWMEKNPSCPLFLFGKNVPCLDFECMSRNICWEPFAKLLKGFFPAEGLLAPGERQAGE